MPSGLIQWITGGGSTATSTTTIGNSATVYQAIQQAQHGLFSQTATNSGSALAALYNNQTATSATTWVSNNCGLVTTTKTAAGTVYWYTDMGNTIVWEEDVTNERYLALAQERARRQQLEHERIQREIAEQQEHYRQVTERNKAALAKSRELLLKHLTPAQRKTFEENAWFVVQGGVTKMRYRIRTTGYTGNIEILHGHDDRVTHRLCGHLRGGYALHDHHVAQKISLEYDEEAFVRICNRHAA
jgi:hypothetical protein